MRDLVARSSSFSEDSSSPPTNIVGASGAKPVKASPRVCWDGDMPHPINLLAHKEESSRDKEEAEETFREAGPREERYATKTIAGVKT
jgi:hypothetical protein